jgi:hypothetical protein
MIRRVPHVFREGRKGVQESGHFWSGNSRVKGTVGRDSLNPGAASEIGVDEEQVTGILAAIAPIVVRRGPRLWPTG